nr:hypothetical protein [Tanacetum cinerariifolium]
MPPIYDEYYDKESIIFTNMDIFETPSSDAITTSHPVLLIEDLEVSLIMENEELNTIPEKKSDKFIKSSVGDLVPIPSESEDTSGSENGYYDSEGYILYLENLLNDDLVHRVPYIHAMSAASILEGFTDKPPLKENDALFDLEPKNDDWKKI